MSRIEFKECTLEEATHVEMGGKMYEFGNGFTSRHKSLKSKLWDNIEVKNGTEGWQLIHVDTFPILGIKPMRERKRQPIEFEGIVKQSRLSFLCLDNVPEGVPLGTKFKCVQILEEEE